MGGPGSGRKKGSQSGTTWAARVEDPSNVDPSTNSKVLKFSRELLKLAKPIDLKDAQAIEDRFLEFLELCERCQVRPLLNAAAQSLTIPRDVLSGVGSNHPQFAHYGRLSPESRLALQLIYQTMTVIIETSTAEEKGSPVKWFFLAKNGYGFQDQSERIVRIEQKELPSMDSEEAERRYAALAGRPIQQLPQSESVEIEPESVE